MFVSANIAIFAKVAYPHHIVCWVVVYFNVAAFVIAVKRNLHVDRAFYEHRLCSLSKAGRK